jgi:tetratricopeptide (TPR) repeat protein
LESAVKEDNFALSVCPVENFFYPEIVTHLGLTFMEGGALGKAEEQFDRAISTHPEYAGAYVAKAALLKKKGSVDAAIAVLLKGSESTEGQSAEVENALGLAYFQEKNYQKASEHARKAYSLGYPLPGLRDKLAKAGYPL